MRPKNLRLEKINDIQGVKRQLVGKESTSSKIDGFAHGEEEQASSSRMVT